MLKTKIFTVSFKIIILILVYDVVKVFYFSSKNNENIYHKTNILSAILSSV